MCCREPDPDRRETPLDPALSAVCYTSRVLERRVNRLAVDAERELAALRAELVTLRSVTRPS